MRNNKNKVLGCLALIIFLAIWLPTFGNLKTDSWTIWIYNFQALIAGFVAAGAAGLTVFEMRRSTNKQLEIFSKQLLQQQLPEIRRMNRCYEELSHFDIRLGFMSMFDDFKQIKGQVGTEDLQGLLHVMGNISKQYTGYTNSDYMEIPIQVHRNFKSLMDEFCNIRDEIKNYLKSERDMTSIRSVEKWERAQWFRKELEEEIIKIQQWILREYPDVNKNFG